PDVNGDGTVVIGVMSPGDTKDNGYYQSFVQGANDFAGAQGWKVVTVDKINPSDSVNQALNLCKQNVDLVAIGASELKDAISAATDPACAGVQWYINGGAGVEQTPYFTQSQDAVNPTLFTSGYAAGLAMKEKGATKAGFITGPELDFSKQAAAAFAAGIENVIPDAEVVNTYTGDFNDSAKAKEAAQAMIDQGVGLIYPYLGGATDAVAQLANESGVLTVTPGTDRCEDTTTPFSISSIFDPGVYFAAALGDFAKGALPMGEARVWKLGVDPVPTVKVCGDLSTLQPQVDELMASIGDGTLDVDALVDGAAAS
ncbi:MAG: BMP family ABC transporter substrate-binding protein, partial [Candidatus Nanopelagicales bacterium]|nr:BMP family ABC transporter substrate-binding protein [Candidatus Nanopelagicales bacterium]